MFSATFTFSVFSFSLRLPSYLSHLFFLCHFIFILTWWKGERRPFRGEEPVRLGIVVFLQLTFYFFLFVLFYFGHFCQYFRSAAPLCTVSVGIRLIFYFKANELSIRLNFELICDLLPLVLGFMGWFFYISNMGLCILNSRRKEGAGSSSKFFFSYWVTSFSNQNDHLVNVRNNVWSPRYP